MVREEIWGTGYLSSLLPVVGRDTGTGKSIPLIHGSLIDVSESWVLSQGLAYVAPGMLLPNRSHLSQMVKRVLAKELSGLINRTLDVNGAGEEIRLACDKQRGS